MSLRIGIAGAGIGGLAAAALLADRGHAVTVFDQFEAPKPVGSGLVIQPVGLAVLDQIGAGDAARELGARIARMLGHEADSGRPVLDVHYDRNGTGLYGLGIHRAALFDVLYEAVKRRTVALTPATRVIGREGQVLLSEEGGRHGPFDLLIDAAGATSPLSPLHATPLPYGAIWGTVDWPETGLPPNQLTQRYRKADRMIGALPVGQLPGDPAPKAAIFWSLPKDGYEAWMTAGLEAWKAEASQLWPEFAPFLDQVLAADQMTHARYTHGTLRHPYDDGIVHIGDAAHRASPQLGQGANMALLDAYAVAKALDRDPLPNVGRTYALARRWHVMAYQAMSAAFTPQYQSDSQILPILRDRILFPVSQVWPVPRILSALVKGTMVPPLGSLTLRGDDI